MRELNQGENVSKPFEEQYLTTPQIISPQVEESFPLKCFYSCGLDNGIFCLSDFPQELSKGVLIKYLEIPNPKCYADDVSIHCKIDCFISSNYKYQWNL